MDGHDQPEVLHAAETALRALADGRAPDAHRALRRLDDLDRVGMFTDFREVVETAVGHVEAGNPIPPMTWDLIAQAAGPGPLSILVEDLKAEAGIPLD